jgi:hypothetical protein
MPEMEDSRPARPLLTLRLGITGARDLPSDQLDHIRSQLKHVVKLAKAEMERLSSLKKVADSYASGPSAVLLPRMYLITPLARGADRLAATEALKQRCQIYVPMPFPQAVYEESFTGGNPSDANALSAEEDCAEFRQLLSSASGRMEMDGELSSGPGDDDSAGRAYEAVGRFVVRHCDLLLAVWDGKQSNGRGGTAEIVHYAATAGVPVWWIHAQNKLEPAWLANIQDIQDPVPESLPAEAKLKAYLKRLISPPVPRHKRSWWEQLVSWFGEKDISPESIYFKEGSRARRRIWKTYSTMMNWAGRTHKDWRAAASPIDPVARYWFNRYAIADGRATDYADRYRSSYLWTIVLTTLTLFFGAFSLGLVLSNSTRAEHLSFAMAVCELLMLILIVAFVAFSFHRGWHRKSIEYRLLAELFRKEETLEALGWALSVGNVQRLADADRLSWVAWLFAATQRGAPLPEGSIAGKESGRAILFNLIDGQLAYHRRREKTALNASLILEGLSWVMFIALFVCVVLKLIMREHHALLIGLLATVLPGISAAFVAIRSYAELQLLAEQSHHMILELHSARLRVSRLNINRALVSQDLGAQAAAIATLMLQDLDGWGRLFRGKLMEA